MGKGGDWERRYVNAWRDRGVRAMRAPTSGGGTAEELPDVLVFLDDAVLAVEHKYRATPSVNLPRHEINALNRFCESAALLTPWVALRTDGRTYASEWRHWPTSELHENEKSYSITQEMWSDQIETIDWFLE